MLYKFYADQARERHEIIERINDDFLTDYNFIDTVINPTIGILEQINLMPWMVIRRKFEHVDLKYVGYGKKDLIIRITGNGVYAILTDGKDEENLKQCRKDDVATWINSLVKELRKKKIKEFNCQTKTKQLC